MSQDPFYDAALGAATAARGFLGWMEEAAERLAPERMESLAAESVPHHRALIGAMATLEATTAPPEIEPFAHRLLEGLRHAEQASRGFGDLASIPGPARIPVVLEALHEAAACQEAFYPLRGALPPLQDLWPPPDAVRDGPARGDEKSPTGIIHVSPGGHHGGFACYVPEHYRDDAVWPVIVALHGGSGNGRDFLWTWMREAKRRGYLLIAPSARESTWGEDDATGLLEILRWASERYRMDPDRLLLTGLSDGGTFTLVYGLLRPTLWRALAPLCGVFHPANEPLGNLERARDVPVYLVHGALDFLFPVAMARYTKSVLEGAGADLTYRELPDLSHTYPRSENSRILDWFEALGARRTEDS